MFSIHEGLSKLDLNNTQMNYDANSLYFSAICDIISIFAKIETGYAFEPHMSDIHVNDFNNETFNQDGKNSAIFKKLLQST